MNGIVLKPELMDTGCTLARFLNAWVQDTHTALRDLFDYKFYEFDPGGRDGYITQIGYLLYEEIIPLDQYQIAAIEWMKSNPLTGKNWSGYEQIFSELFCQGVAEWISENLDIVYAQVGQLRRDKDFHNMGQKLYVDLAYKVASARGCGRNRYFLQQFWYSDPTPYRIFTSAFSYDGKYGVEAEEAIVYFIKMSRRQVTIARKENYHGKKSFKKKYHKTYDEIYREELKRIVGRVHSLLVQRYGLYQYSDNKYTEMDPSKRAILDMRNRLIEEKIERIIRDQNVACLI